MKVQILACAEAELAEATAYYNEQCPGLGYEFAAEVNASLERIGEFSGAWPSFSPRARRCIVNRFPYGVLYQVREESVLVLAIMHLKRDPKRWQDRLRKAPNNDG